MGMVFGRFVSYVLIIFAIANNGGFDGNIEDIVRITNDGVICLSEKTTSIEKLSAGDDGCNSIEVVDVYDEKLDIVDISNSEYSYAEMVTDINLLMNKYGGKVNYNILGVTVDNRYIYEIVLGNNEADKKIIIQGATHGREYMTSQLLMKQIEYYLANIDAGSYNGRQYSDLFDSYSIHIMPMVNPDGVALSLNGLDGLNNYDLRYLVYDIYKADYSKGKTIETDINVYLKRWKANVRGVDINRNYKTGWGLYNLANKNSMSYYRGEKYESEAETTAIVKWVNDMENIVASISYHSKGEVLYWDCAQTGSFREDCLNLVNEISKINGYTIITSHGYDDKIGSFCDWCVLEKQIPNVTIEVGKGECPLEIDEFNNIWAQNIDVLPAVMMFYD